MTKTILIIKIIIIKANNRTIGDNNVKVVKIIITVISTRGEIKVI